MEALYPRWITTLQIGNTIWNFGQFSRNRIVGSVIYENPTFAKTSVIFFSWKFIPPEKMIYINISETPKSGVSKPYCPHVVKLYAN